MQTEINNTDYNQSIQILGTAHFTKRSLEEAHQAVSKTGTKDLAVELDLKRFRLLNSACPTCPKRPICTNKCEFIAASEALGNVDANIWLIDMSQEQMTRRIRQLMTRMEASRGFLIFNVVGDERKPWLWEKGFKEKVLRQSQEELEALRRARPSVWRVLVKERNVIMAARLAWIASKRMDEGEEPNILGLVGAAHADEIRELLRRPVIIKESLQRLGIPFSPPVLIRRVGISGD